MKASTRAKSKGLKRHQPKIIGGGKGSSKSLACNNDGDGGRQQQER